MTDAWASYPGAPAPGTDLCNLEDIPDPGARGVAVGDVSILVVRHGGRVTGFMNACPHQYLPLDYRRKDVLSADTAKLICSNHDAVFDAETGEGLGGHGQGCQLDPVPLETVGGRIFIAK